MCNVSCTFVKNGYILYIYVSIFRDMGTIMSRYASVQPSVVKDDGHYYETDTFCDVTSEMLPSVCF